MSDTCLLSSINSASTTAKALKGLALMILNSLNFIRSYTIPKHRGFNQKLFYYQINKEQIKYLLLLFYDWFD